MRTYAYNLTNYINMSLGQLPFSLLTFIAARQGSRWKVMLSVMCVCQSVCSQRGIPPYKALVDLYLALEALDMLKLIQFGPDCIGTPQDTFKLVHYEAPTVGKRAVGIRLEYFLVLYQTSVFGRMTPSL